MANTKTMAERLCEAAKLIGWGLEKDGSVMNRYRYTSSASTLRSVGAALAKAGIATTVAVEPLAGCTINDALVRVTVTYHAPGCESLSTQGIGAGKTIKGDEKAILKAQSSGIKYAHILAMNIGMGQDPEEDDALDPEPEKPKAQRREPDESAKIVASIVTAYKRAQDTAQAADASVLKDKAWARLSEGQRREVNAARQAAVKRLVPKTNGRQEQGA